MMSKKCLKYLTLFSLYDEDFKEWVDVNNLDDISLKAKLQVIKGECSFFMLYDYTV